MKRTKFIMNRLLLLTLLSGPLATAVPVLATDFEKTDKTSEIKESTSQTSEKNESFVIMGLVLIVGLTVYSYRGYKHTY